MYKIVADLHTHTTASSHAYSTITENAKFAAETGLCCIGMTNHGVAMPDSPHIWHFHNITTVPQELFGVKILRGVEANIVDFEGTLDIQNHVLEYMEIVIASFHAPVCRPKTSVETTQAYLKLAEHPFVDVIGHSGTPAFSYDYKRVIPIFKECGKLVEINNKSSVVRIGAAQNCLEIAKICKKYSVPVVVNSDAHFWTEVGEVDEALNMLKEIEFPLDLIINSNKEQFQEWLSNHRK